MVSAPYSTFATYREFKRETHIPAFCMILGIFLSIFQLAVKVYDEKGKVHYVSRLHLSKWASSHAMPALDGKILVTKIKRVLKESDFFWPSSLPKAFQEELQSRILKERRYASFFLPLEKRCGYSVLNIPKKGIYLVKEGGGKQLQEAVDLLSPAPCVPQQVDALFKLFGSRWPAETEKELGISVLGQELIRSFLFDKASEWKGFDAVKFSKKQTHLPCSIAMIPNSKGYLKRVFLLLSGKKKGLVGEGGQRKIKYAYDLFAGEMAVKKPIVERELIALKGLKGKKGFAKCLGFLFRNHEPTLFFEPLYKGDLLDLMNSKASSTIAQKISICRGVIEAVFNFHALQLEGQGRAYHADIKTANVLYRFLNGNRIEVALCDFGFSNYFESFAGTLSWFSPEYARVWLSRKGMSAAEKKAFNECFGQKQDLWGLGLFLASVLKWDRGMRPGCLHASGTDDEILHAILKLDQETVDKEIDACASLEQDEQLKAIWGIVKLLLRIDPEERVPAADLMV